MNYFAEISSEVKSSCGSDGIFTETEDEGFFGGPGKSTTNIGWLVGLAGNHAGQAEAGKSAHIDIYEAGQAKPPPYLNVKEVPPSNASSSPTSTGYGTVVYFPCISVKVTDLVFKVLNTV